MARKRGRTSWIYEQGYGLIEWPSLKDFWACKACDNKKKFKLFTGASTVNPRDHLIEFHGFFKEGVLDEDSFFNISFSESSDLFTIPGLFNKSLKRQKKEFFPKQTVDFIKDKFIKQIVNYKVALVAVEDPPFRDLIYFFNTGIASFLPESGDIIRSWLMEAFEFMKNELKKELHETSINVFHIFFDLWTALNIIPFMAVVVYYTDSTFKNCTKLLTFKRLHGSHSEEHMAVLLIQILKEFDIEKRLGYFMTDNASSNDLCIDFILQNLFLTSLPPSCHDPYRSVGCMRFMSQDKGPLGGRQGLPRGGRCMSCVRK